MAVRNVEIRKDGEKYIILEQAGSDRHGDKPVHEAAGRAEAESWLRQQGGDPAQVAKVLEDAETAPQAFLELSADWSEAEQFPRR